MDDETKNNIHARYERHVARGERFWPDSIYKDLLVSLGIFILLVLLASFVGVPVEPKADPTDTSYIPRPEWYFLFLFKFLALYGQIPALGKIEWIATVLIPTLAIGLLFALPFMESSPARYYSKRALPIAVLVLIVVAMVVLTLMSDVPTVSADGSTLIGLLQAIGALVFPALGAIVLVLLTYVFKGLPVRYSVWTTAITSALMVAMTAVVLSMAPAVAAEAPIPSTLVDQISAGQDLYSVNCSECHGANGEVTTITGVKGLEGKQIPPINGSDVLYTLNDDSMAQVIAYGRPQAGMNPFGKAYNPAGLSRSEIDEVVTFMRYTWDDRFEAPVMPQLFPPLAAAEVPSYEVHIKPIVKRYCAGCHVDGKTNNNYIMTSYADILSTGDNSAKDVIAGSMDSYLIRVVQGHSIADPADPGKILIRTMPPSSKLKADVIDVLVRWVISGMPETAQDAGKLTLPSITPTP